MRAGDGRDEATAVAQVMQYAAALDPVAAEQSTTPVIRYEDLLDDPVTTCRQLCEFLGVPPDDSMLEYGRHDHGRFIYGIGDWSDEIRSGQIQRARPVPPPSPPALMELCSRWGSRPNSRRLDRERPIVERVR